MRSNFLHETIPVREWKLKWRQEHDQIQRKRAAIDAYKVILDKIAEGHQKLYDQRNALGSKATLQVIFQYVSDIHTQLEAVEKAFEPQPAK